MVTVSLILAAIYGSAIWHRKLTIGSLWYFLHCLSNEIGEMFDREFANIWLNASNLHFLCHLQHHHHSLFTAKWQGGMTQHLFSRWYFFSVISFLSFSWNWVEAERCQEFSNICSILSLFIVTCNIITAITFLMALHFICWVMFLDILGTLNCR